MSGPRSEAVLLMVFCTEAPKDFWVAQEKAISCYSDSPGSSMNRLGDSNQAQFGVL
jgi:hypothetical protein